MKIVVAVWASSAGAYQALELAALRGVELGEALSFRRSNPAQFNPAPAEVDHAVSRALVQSGLPQTEALSAYYKSLGVSCTVLDVTPPGEADKKPKKPKE